MPRRVILMQRQKATREWSIVLEIFTSSKSKTLRIFPDVARACYELQNSAVNQTDATKYVKRAILQCRRRKLGETINLLDKKEI